MKNLPFIQELTEARMFFGPDDLKHKSAVQIAEIVFLMFMMLEVIRHYKPGYTSTYANDTLKYNTYESMKYAATDLGNLLAVLNNQDTFKAYIKTESGVSIPLFQINRYLRDLSSNSKSSHSEDVTFFWRLEDYLKLYSNSLLRQLRRDIGNWKDLTRAEKQQIYLILRREFDKRCSSVDMYLWYKSGFKITEEITEAFLGIHINSKNRDSDQCTVPGLYRDAADFAASKERYKEIPEKTFLQAVGPIPPNLNKTIRQDREYYYDDDNDVYIIYDGHTDAIFFFSPLNQHSLVAETIDDTKLAYHSELNTDLWDGYELKPDVKEALGKIANKFAEFVDIKQLKITDYIITGSNCAYNYTSQSDIDLHIEFDTSKIGNCPLTEPFLTAKKALWNSGHDITIKGYNVELYAEDQANKNDLVATGVYSLLSDKWLKQPEYKEITFNDAAVISKAEGIAEQIDELVKTGGSEEEIHSLREHIKKMRRAGLERGGEFDVSNLAFKVLRNNGYLDKLAKLKSSREDKELSLNEKLKISGDWDKKVYAESYSIELDTNTSTAFIECLNKDSNIKMLKNVIEQIKSHGFNSVRSYAEHNSKEMVLLREVGFKEFEKYSKGSHWLL